MDFEKRGTSAYNESLRRASDLARRQPASGALPFLPGDMVSEEELTACVAEFKERGTLSASGEKQITIKRDWLEKLRDEASMLRKDHYFLPFSFKGDDNCYVVMDYNVLLSYVQTIHFFIKKHK